MRIVTIAPRSGLGHELLTNLNSAVVVFGDSEILWIQKPSHLVNATTPGPFSYLRLRGAGLLENPEYQWLAIKGSQKLPGLLWGVRDDACELYYTICACELKKKNTTTLLLVQHWLGILHVLYVVHILYDDVFL